ncbi:NAD(P)/FAD-dependent oxidoreductase [Streptomyces sp. NPDC091292]|uniref:NAD(P)/FAD-dependent oxidoreductase n=1 Tax=Streptomyces sp. NPDC091292 TaxID=3365991 RepID=UPI0037F26D89
MPSSAQVPRATVIGAGLAGVRFIRRLAELDPGTADRTVLVGDEPHAPYNRVLLTDVLAGRYAPHVITLPRPHGTHLRTRAIRIDRAARTVHCADGTSLPYRTLVLATGAHPVRPPLRGHTFRTMDDCLALSAAVRPGTRVLVVGGGPLGVSAARALAARGARVVLAEREDRLMKSHLDATAAEFVRQHLHRTGVDVRTSWCPPQPRTAPPGTDLTVLACGARPRTGLARAAGLTVRSGIVVDDELRTSDPHIRAIGDCAEHAGRVYGHAAPALEQADALAASLTAPPHSEPARYHGTRALTRLTLDGTGPADPFDLAAFGSGDTLPGDDVVQLTDATRRTYRKVVVRGERLVGGVLVGALGSVGALARAWADGEPLTAAGTGGGPPLHLLTPDGGR